MLPRFGGASYKFFFSQLAILAAGGVVGAAAADLLHNHSWLALFIFFCLASVGLGYGFLVFVPYMLASRFRRSVALLAPFEVTEDRTSSWTKVPVDEIVTSCREKGIPVYRTRSYFAATQHPIILNPYGGAYLEEEPEQFGSFHKLLGWVRGGGIFVNIADIPFYYSVSDDKGWLSDTTPLLNGAVPIRSFFDTLVARNLGVVVWAIGNERAFEVSNSDLKKVRSLEPRARSIPVSYQLQSNPSGPAQAIQTTVSGFVAVRYGKGQFVFLTANAGSRGINGIVKAVERARDIAQST